jgi:hypothetical protein
VVGGQQPYTDMGDGNDNKFSPRTDDKNYWVSSYSKQNGFWPAQDDTLKLKNYNMKDVALLRLWSKKYGMVPTLAVGHFHAGLVVAFRF